MKHWLPQNPLCETLRYEPGFRVGSARQNYRGAQFPFIHALSFRDRTARTFSLADPLVNQGRQSGLRLQLCRGGVGGSKIWCQETEAVLASMHRLAIACQTNPTAGDCVGAKMTRCGFPECPLPQPKASYPQQSAATFRRAQGQRCQVRSNPSVRPCAAAPLPAWRPLPCRGCPANCGLRLRPRHGADRNPCGPGQIGLVGCAVHPFPALLSGQTKS